MARVTAGPASAMSSSCRGSSGMRSRRATPPMGRRMTSGVRTPKRRAIRMWPNSWNSTQANSASSESAASSAPDGPPCWYPAIAQKATRMKKVRWTLTSVPATRPIVMVQPIRRLRSARRRAPPKDRRSGGPAAQPIARSPSRSRPLKSSCAPLAQIASDGGATGSTRSSPSGSRSAQQAIARRRMIWASMAGRLNERT